MPFAWMVKATHLEVDFNDFIKLFQYKEFITSDASTIDKNAWWLLIPAYNVL